MAKRVIRVMTGTGFVPGQKIISKMTGGVMMAKLHIMCGIPGCGKSTLAQQLNGRVISTDKIRERIKGDVFDIAHEAVQSWLSQGQDVVFDATNTTRTARDPLIKIGKCCAAKVIVHRIKCPVEVAIKRNESRDRKVPVAAIKAFYAKFEEPEIGEGIDEILIYNSDLQLQDEIIPDKSNVIDFPVNRRP